MKFSPSVEKVILETTAENEGVYFLEGTLSKKRFVMYCNGKEDNIAKCNEMPGITFETEKILN